MGRSEAVYPGLSFPPAPADRPYVYINMVATIDGKTVSGDRDEPVQDIGSDTDHETMRAIEAASDAVLVGAGSLRATKGLHYRPGLVRIVATGSGRVPAGQRFFTDEPERAFVATSEEGAGRMPSGLRCIVSGRSEIAWPGILRALREQHSVERLLVEGGSELNASLLHEDLVDELFLTLAPKVKLGRETPTYAGGDPLPRDRMLQFAIASCRQVGDEIFVRYRRDR